ncbi:MAG: hypothetical protein H7832_09365 [Magnetococcus sp. DMHC-6]
MKILGVRLGSVRLPLSSSYELAFATVHAIDVLLVWLSLEDGRIGLGETVPLPGYSDETAQSIIADLTRTLPLIVGMQTDDLATYFRVQLPHSPFAVSAVLTAKEFALEEVKLPKHAKIPLVAPISTGTDLQSSLAHAKALYDQGYRTIKLKVGRDIEADCRYLLFLLEELPKEMLMRLDANQGYSVVQAQKLSTILAKHPKNHRVECFEQPLGIKMWEEFHGLTKEFPTVPFMLDESIIQDEDVDRAAQVGARLIKLKLFKHRSLNEVVRLAEKAKRFGMQIIFGNGVATDVGNLAEMVAFQQEGLFYGAFEGNGFSKLKQSLLQEPPTVVEGHLYWQQSGNNPWTLNKTGMAIKPILSAGKGQWD